MVNTGSLHMALRLWWSIGTISGSARGQQRAHASQDVGKASKQTDSRTRTIRVNYMRPSAALHLWGWTLFSASPALQTRWNLELD
ncbi:hypothetical protein B0T26DRAFT_349363 [Lasiosphaeria miniovina]|uniref:Secreted protein n=1 Tax=Lasiosphaeria miniovina TaxID=1954250 RepID=A0AA40DV67_9PEZI|nr:uncharacterized protein B0T26DRAFT_349363 [Lasiosphaeria miniovina]KAK0712953.1 hypothetical protein B0T26DRAFT_349363 [Lasiosphaeria miniovina]